MVKGSKKIPDKEEPSKEIPTEENTKNEVAESAEFDIGDLEGVGAVRKQRLLDAGITNPMDLVVRGPVEISEITGMDRDIAENVVTKAREFMIEREVMQKTFQSGREKLEYRKERIDANRISSGCDAFK